MAKRKDVSEMHSVEFGFRQLSKRKAKCLSDKFYYKYKLQCDYVNFINEKIKSICKQDSAMQTAWDTLYNSRKQNGIYVNKSDEADSIYNARKIIWGGIKKYKLLQNETLREFKEKMSHDYFLYLEDCFISNAIKEKTDAFETVYAKGIGYTVSSAKYDDVRSLTSRPEYSGSNHYTRAISLYENDGKFYVRFRDSSPECIAEYKKQELRENFHQHIYKKMDIRVPVDFDDILQSQIKSNEFRGAIRLVRRFRGTKWRYGIQISYYKRSPILDEIPVGNHTIAINIQTETRAIVRDDGYQEIIEFAPNSPRITSKICELDRYMDTLKRINNPDLFSEDGQIKYKKCEMQNLGLNWKYSRRYKDARNKRRELYRHLADSRKTSNLTDAKQDIIKFGAGSIILDNNQFIAWKTKLCRMSKKSKEIYDNGVRKRDYTKQIADRAPGTYVARIEHLCDEVGIECRTISRFDSSTYNHFTGQNDIFTELNQRLILMDTKILGYEYNDKVIPFINTISTISDERGNKYIVQRDLYAAAKMLYCQPCEEIRLGKNNKEYTVRVDKFDAIGFSKFFKEIFYPKHLAYLQQLVNIKKLEVNLNTLILGS